MLHAQKVLTPFPSLMNRREGVTTKKVRMKIRDETDHFEEGKKL